MTCAMAANSERDAACKLSAMSSLTADRLTQVAHPVRARSVQRGGAVLPDEAALLRTMRGGHGCWGRWSWWEGGCVWCFLSGHEFCNDRTMPAHARPCPPMPTNSDPFDISNVTVYNFIICYFSLSQHHLPCQFIKFSCILIYSARTNRPPGLGGVRGDAFSIAHHQRSQSSPSPSNSRPRRPTTFLTHAIRIHIPFTRAISFGSTSRAIKHRRVVSWLSFPK